MAEFCQLCEQAITREEMLHFTASGPTVIHRECGLRSVLGGIGHLTDHEFWCGVLHDPDAGHSYRESALLVAEWVRLNGVPT